MREPIFDAIDRHDRRPAEHNETSFAFLNRVPGGYWEEARRLVQAWADRLADPAEYNELRQRFRSRDDEQFRSAYLELYLHESLIRAGYAVTIHPPLAHTTRTPDFLAERDGRRLYVEAIAPGAAAETKAAARRRADLFDVVDRLRHPNFMLWLDKLEEGETPPAAAKLRKALRHWLDGLDPDAITSIEGAPLWSWHDNGWAVRFRPIPKRPDVRGVREMDRSIGVYGHTEVSVVDDAPAIRAALTEKHRAYGDLGAPFVIAVGTYIHDTERWHSTAAMYGAVSIQWYEDDTGQTVTREVRQPGGYFGQPPQWDHTNVSGVLLVNQLMPYSVPRADVTLWRHPAPLHPLPHSLGLPVADLALNGTTLVETQPDLEPSEFFELTDPWPPGDAWADQEHHV